MKIIALMSQKGGAGKSTLAAHLAVAAQAKGLQVKVFDCDPQGSLMSWSAIRKGDLVQAVQPRNLREALSKVSADLVIVDTAGQIDGLDTLEPMLCADLVLVPVRPSAFDIAATHRTLALLKANNKKGLVVLSSAPLRAPEIAMARQALAGSTPIAETVIHDRRPFSRAIQTGRSVGEMDATSPAAIEVNLLLGEIL